MITLFLLQFLFSVTKTIISVILLPINILIDTYLPSLSTAISSINSMLEMFSDSLVYAVSWTLLGQTALQIIVLYYTFILIFPLLAYVVKIAIIWYKNLK